MVNVTCGCGSHCSLHKSLFSHANTSIDVWLLYSWSKLSKLICCLIPWDSAVAWYPLQSYSASILAISRCFYIRSRGLFPAGPRLGKQRLNIHSLSGVPFFISSFALLAFIYLYFLSYLCDFRSLPFNIYFSDIFQLKLSFFLFWSCVCVWCVCERGCTGGRETGDILVCDTLFVMAPTSAKMVCSPLWNTSLLTIALPVINKSQSLLTWQYQTESVYRNSIAAAEWHRKKWPVKLHTSHEFVRKQRICLINQWISKEQRELYYQKFCFVLH